MSAADVQAANAESARLNVELAEQNRLLEEATAEVAAIDIDVAASQESERVARAAQEAASAEVTRQLATAAEARQRAEQSQLVLGRWAASAYIQGPGVPQGILVMLGSNSTDELAAGLATQRMVGRQLDADATAYEQARQQAAHASAAAQQTAATAAATLAAATRAREEAEQRRADASARISERTILRDAVAAQAEQAGVRARQVAGDYAVAQAAEAAAAQAAAAAAAQASASAGGGGSAIVITGDPQAQEVLRIAAGLTGIEYRWGGTTPAGFDCSGFTGYVFAQVGVRLPRTAREQQAAATVVSDPRPGDLVFFGRPATHVGIYAGNGMMYDSPHSGAVSALRPVHRGVSNYGRVLPVRY
ncbi:MAG: NlpC/P60 family protein [Actinomycetales bacterium]